jgi:hypothetical protein
MLLASFLSRLRYTQFRYNHVNSSNRSTRQSSPLFFRFALGAPHVSSDNFHMSQNLFSCPPVPVDNPVLVSLTSSIISNHFVGKEPSGGRTYQNDAAGSKTKSRSYSKNRPRYLLSREVNPVMATSAPAGRWRYCGRIAVQMIGNFYDGFYRRYA